MKKSIIYSMVPALLGLIVLSSCSDFLDGSKQNRSNIDDSNITQEQRLNQAFAELREVFDGGSLLNQFVMGTDIYVNQANNTGGQLYYEYKMTPDEEELYTDLYKVINNANAAISNDNSQVDCDARFLRALSYYYLTQQFGAVPYLEQTITNANREYPRKAVKDIYDNTIADLEKVYKDGNIPTTAHDGHCSKASVAALISKLALAAGWDTEVTPVNYAEQGEYSFNGDKDGYFAKAEQFATNAINDAGGEDALVDTYENKWSPTNEGNTEELFSIQYDKDNLSNYAHSWASGFCGYHNDPAQSGQKIGNHLNNPSKKMLALYTKGDQRFDATFMTTMYAFDKSSDTWGNAGYFAYYNKGVDKASLGITYRFLPPYYTYDDMKQDFAEHASQYSKGEATVIRMGDNLTYYSCTSATTDIPAESSLKSINYYTDSNPYTGYLFNFDGKTTTGMMCKKWDDELGSQSKEVKQTFRDVVLLSLSDIFLVRAEAKMMLGGSKGNYLDDVNVVRKRAGAEQITSLAAYNPTYSHNFTLRDIDIILDERALELFGEATRWEDLRRTKQLVLYYNNFSVYSATSQIGRGANIKWYRPIPLTEIENNNAISNEDQNPGY